MEKVGRIALKTILWIVGSILFLVLLVLILIQIPAVQNFAKNKAVTFLENKIHTKVKIGHLGIEFPKLIVLDDVYFEDPKKDTLIAGDKLKVDISMLKLLHSQVEVNEVNLQGITLKVYRDKDSVFNFDYILKAFTSGPPKPADTTSSMKFSVDKINLDKINIAYKDLTTGNDVKFLLGHFDTRITDFDMDKMKFTIPKITLAGFNARIIQTPSGSSIAQAAAVDTATKPLNMTLNLGIIDLTKINVYYRSKEMTTTLNLGQFLAEFNKIDLKNQNVDIKNFEINDTRAGLTFAKPQTVQKAVVKTVKKLDTLVSTNQTTKGWTAILRKVSFANNDVKFDNDAQKPIPRGLDYAHMNIHHLNVELENLAYSPDTISGKVNTLTFSEKSGLAIRKFHTAFFYGPKNTKLDDLYLETPQSIIQKKVDIGYQSMATISDHLGDIKINADLDGTRLGLKDVILLVPSMASMEPFKSSPNEVLKINGKAVGQVNDLRVHGLEVSGLTGVYVKASAVLKGLPDINKAYFDVDLNNFNINRNAINRLAPKGTIPSNISIPENLNLKGTFKGGMTSFNTNLKLRSSYGDADLVASLKNGNSKKNASYAANLKAVNLNAGAFLKQPQNVGMITLTADIKGYGLDPKTASLQFNGDVVSATVKGYTYKNLIMKGNAHNGNYAAIASMRDTNISFNLDAKANMNNKYPSVSGTFVIDSVNVQKLGFSKDPLRVHGKIVADVPTADPDYLNANIKATDLLILNKGQRIKVDTVSLVSTATADSSTLRLKSQLLSAHMAGKYKLTEIAAAFQDFGSKYFNRSVANANIKTKTKYSPEKFAFDLRLVKTPMIEKFAPDLKQLDPILIDGHFDSEAEELVVNGSIPKVVYGTTMINNGKLAINTSNNAINYSLTIDEVKQGTSIDLLYTSLTGTAQNDKLNLSLQIRDAAKKERFRIAGVFSIMPDEYQFSFLPNGLLLDYTQWTVNPNNALQFGTKGIMARDFAISNSNQILSINSNPQQFNAPVTVDFHNFKIETFTRIARQDSLQVGGVINGSANISDFQASPAFTTALNISDLNFKGDTIGNVALKVDNKTANNAYTANMSITGKGSQVDLDGVYYTAPESRFDLNLNIVKLRMKGIEGLSFGAIRGARGNITGQLKISGTTTAPMIRGDLTFNQVGFNVSMLNSYFSMPNETISFNNEGIAFNNFTVIDSTGNKASINGTVYTKTYTDFDFGLDIRADNFRVINSTKANNKLYYGQLYVNSRIKIRGDINLPVVDANITVNDKTNLTIVLPTADPGVEDRAGVVEFIDQNSPKTDSILLAKRIDSLRKSDLNGLDVNATININKNANFNIIIDERNGDVVHIQGGGNLNAGIDPSGKINLTGTYTVTQGSYNLAYATVKRTFKFKPGSTITWAGDPTTAKVDLTAIYVAHVAPIDLVNDQLAGQNSTQYKEKLPFNVNLSLKNELMKPDITFDIQLPDSNYSVSTEVVNTTNSRLTQIRQDPNAMNKQVLGVLVLGHFIGDNPLQSRSPGANVSGMVRNSVSSLLSDQLNRLAGDLITGVDVNFNLTSGADYSTGTQQNRTDLNVGLSKRFLNDRLTVTVGNNFMLEGQTQPGQSNIAGNASVNYKLTKDGRYIVRAYTKNDYIVVQGQVVETGVGFTLTVDYDHFKQIFSSSREDKEARKRIKEEKQRKKEAEKEKEKQQQQVQETMLPQPADETEHSKNSTEQWQND